ncbi:hypothetical protein C7410_13185 [Paraburkholderia silvatlantica]|uniref:Uncharacterized protein n=1 Tax=Paraburkholderia silvatlantica TaxID=321895 RepID=A0A2V4UEF5_9BURK|nr:hypothetical protein [Paraburkholderia silvatlantica]PYE16137.1 hypothetical protein C7410_13185 [Paraburkholderia silvatlantica]
MSKRRAAMGVDYALGYGVGRPARLDMLRGPQLRDVAEVGYGVFTLITGPDRASMKKPHGPRGHVRFSIKPDARFTS